MDSFGMFAFPAMLLSVMFDIGPHGSTTLFLWALPLFNGIAFAVPFALGLWLRSKISKT